jgi:ATP-dependent helicase/nuclease subunit B
MVEMPTSEVTQRDAPLPLPESRPAPVLPKQRIPRTLSASGYQQLIDCPYLFFGAQGLRLAPPDTIREALEKADYGEKVHRCLQAFHDGVDGLPGPFRQPLSTANRDNAIALLREISEAEFIDESGSRFENHAWLKRWQQLIPLYVDWQIERARDWRVLRHEELCERSDVIDTILLRGRLDRIDEGLAGVAVIDYKTGRVAKEGDVLRGEAVQLPFYALLADNETRHVTQVEYLRMDEGKITSPVVLQGDELEQLREANRERITTLIGQIGAGTPLPAWGDEKSCGRCTLEGLCRRQMWPL